MSSSDQRATPQLYDAACRGCSERRPRSPTTSSAHSSGAALELANTAKALAEAFAALRSTSPPAL